MVFFVFYLYIRQIAYFAQQSYLVLIESQDKCLIFEIFLQITVCDFGIFANIYRLMLYLCINTAIINFKGRTRKGQASR